MKPAIIGYLRRLPGLDDQAEQRAIQELTDYAEAEGFTLAGVFIEKRWLQFAALDALTQYCQEHDVTNVVVPTPEHLHQVPPLGEVMRQEIQDTVQGRVWIARERNTSGASSSSEKDTTAEPTTTKNGGYT